MSTCSALLSRTTLAFMYVHVVYLHVAYLTKKICRHAQRCHRRQQQEENGRAIPGSCAKLLRVRPSGLLRKPPAIPQYVTFKTIEWKR